MKTFMKTIKMDALIMAILCIILGVVLIIWPLMSTKIICVSLGSILIICGLSHIVSYFQEKESLFYHMDLLLGLIFGALGVWIVVKPESILKIIPIIIGVVVFIHGFVNLQQAVHLKQVGYEKWWMALLISLGTIAIGGLMLYNPFNTIATLMIFIGISLVLDGISDIWIITRIAKVAKNIKETFTAIDVEASIIEEKSDSKK